LAVIYDRASTERQRDNYSRADAARLSELAERLGYRWELRREIKSGESLANRPVMKGILEEVEAGMVGAIICQDFTRLSRDEDGIDGRVLRQICYVEMLAALLLPQTRYTTSPWMWTMTWPI
jgi:DNA invertase Pin-like site-specific DNA recombinase